MSRRTTSPRRRFVGALAIVASVAVSFAQQSDTTRNPLAGDPAAVTAGQRLYDQACAACHGPAGQGDRGASLNTGVFVHGSEDGDLFQSIRQGIPAR